MKVQANIEVEFETNSYTTQKSKHSLEPDTVLTITTKHGDKVKITVKGVEFI